MDYFDALLRAAGLAGAADAARHAGPQAEAADLVEVDQDAVLVEPAVDGSVGDEPSPDAPVAAAAEPRVAQAADAVPPVPVQVEQGARQEAIAALTPQPPSPHGPPRHAETAMHPMVQAALHWVAGDPLDRAERAADDPAAPAARGTPAAPPRQATTTISARHQPPADDEQAGPEARRGMRPTLPEVQVAPPPRGIDDAPRQRSVAPEPPAVQRLAPDVHIGVIHVTVDAPRPPVPPTAPVAPVAPPPSAARSDFLRSRAPRV